MSGDEISRQEFEDLCNDVKDIKQAIKGKDEYGQKGFMHRIKNNEEDIEEVEKIAESAMKTANKTNQRVSKAMAWVAGVGAGAGTVGAILFKVITTYLGG